MSRRKPILQIGGRNLNRNTPEPTISTKSSYGGIGLVEDYGAQTDDDENDSAKNKTEDKVNDDSVDIKLADFMKEIDDIETKQADDTTPIQEIDWGSWTQCIDENTNHPYYWNTETNEVTWTVPEEISKQYEQNSPKNEKIEKEVEPEKDVEKDIVNISKEEPVIDIVEQKSPKSKDEILASKFQTNKEYLISKTSLKSAILQTHKKHQEKMREKDRKSPVMIKENISTDVDFDIDAELDNALTTHTKVKKVRLKDEEIDSIAPKKRKIFNGDQIKLTNYAGSSDSDTSEEVKKKENFEEKPTRLDKIIKEEEASNSSEDFSKYNVCELEEGEIDSKSPQPSQPSKFMLFERSFEDKSTQVDSKLLKTGSKNKEKIEEMSGTLLSKLEYFAVIEKESSSFYKLITEIEVRIEDWQAAELSDNYVLKQLNTATTQVNKHEKSFLPDEWSCFWDSEHKRYFFKKEGETVGQWELPKKVAENTTDAPENGDDATSSKTTSAPQPDGYHAGYPDNHAHHPMSINYGYYQQYWNQYNMSQQPYNTNVTQYSDDFQPNNPPEVPPPPPGEETAPLPPSDDSNPPPPPPPGDSQPPLPIPDGVDSPAVGLVGEDGIEMEISDGEEPAKSSEPKRHHVTELKKGPVEYGSHPSTLTQNNKINIKTSENMGKIKKAKKNKREKSVPKKPRKEMVGMVMKWQRAKMEIEEEEKRLILETEEELKAEGDVGKQIQKWKTDQILSGKASTNANFEPVSADWRKKLQERKKKMRS